MFPFKEIKNKLYDVNNPILILNFSNIFLSWFVYLKKNNKHEDEIINLFLNGTIYTAHLCLVYIFSYIYKLNKIFSRAENMIDETKIFDVTFLWNNEKCKETIYKLKEKGKINYDFVGLDTFDKNISSYTLFDLNRYVFHSDNISEIKIQNNCLIC